MKTTIAPTLQDWAACAPICDESRKMQAELRALLAVARAVDGMLVRRPGYTIVKDDLATVTSVRRALDRLERASRAGASTAGERSGT